MASNVIQGMFVKLGYEFDQKQLDNFNNSVIQTRKLLKRAALAAIGLAASLAFVAKKFGSQAIQTDRSAKAIGAETKQLEGFLRVSDKVLGSREAGLSIAQKIAGVQRDLSASGGQGVSETFQRGLADIGLRLSDIREGDPVDVIFKLNKAMQGLSEEAQRNAIFLLGMGDSFELLTEKGLKQQVIKAQTDKNFDALREGSEILTQLAQDFEDFVASFTRAGDDEPFFIVALKWIRDNGIPIIEKMISIMSVGFDFIKTIVEALAKSVASVVSSFNGIGDNKVLNFITSEIKGSVAILDRIGNFIGKSAASIESSLSGSGGTTNNNNQQATFNQTNNITGVPSGGSMADLVPEGFNKISKQALEQSRTGAAN